MGFRLGSFRIKYCSNSISFKCCPVSPLDRLLLIFNTNICTWESIRASFRYRLLKKWSLALAHELVETDQSKRMNELFAQVHSFLITNLALGDLIMGTYLLLIAVVDCYYRGVYFIHDSAWKSSRLCSLAGFLSTFSSELSVFTLTGRPTWQLTLQRSNQTISRSWFVWMFPIKTVICFVFVLKITDVTERAQQHTK